MFNLMTIWEATRVHLITWESFRAKQEAAHARCANGCDAPGKFRTLDDRDLCPSCYAAIAADEQRRVYEAQ